MAKIIDTLNSELIVFGKAIVLPNSAEDAAPNPLNGSLRFNPEIGAAQVFSNGAWITLGEGGGGGSGGSSNAHTHSIAQIIGLQNILNGKASQIHAHTIADIGGLNTALAQKAPREHPHEMANITGLVGALADKADRTHTHTVVVRDTVAGCFPNSPPANYRMTYTAAMTMVFSSNFAGSRVTVNANPASNYTVSLYKNGTTNVGSFTVSPSGMVTFLAPSPLTLLAGDTLTFVCPARDASIDTLSFTLICNRESISTM